MIILQKKCFWCKKIFYKSTKLSSTQWAARMFCCRSHSAFYQSRNGIGAAQIGKPAWNKGTKGIMKANSGSWAKGDKRISGENHHQWSGDNPKYDTVHHWVYKHLGKASMCEFCGVKGRNMYHWSNISGEYYRDLDDWQQLCVPCHSRFDRERTVLA